MKYYIELKTDDFSVVELVIQHIHRSGVGLAFYFGNKTLRVFSDQKDDLKCFPEIMETPKNHKFVICKRVGNNGSRRDKNRKSNLKNHLAKKGIEFDEYKFQESKPIDFDFYLKTNSRSNRSSMFIFIKNIEVDQEKKGGFTSYGLSKNGSTVPLF